MTPKLIAARPAIPLATIVVAVFLLAITGFGPNSMLVLLAIGAFLLGTSLLWRPGESPVLLFVFAFQWVQASIKAFWANVLDVDISILADHPGDISLATSLSLLGLTMLAFGMSVGAGKWHPHDGSTARASALSRSPKFWFYLYGIAAGVATVARLFAFAITGLSQPLLAFSNVKWAFYFMLLYATFVRSGADRRYFWFALGFEFLMGIGGYFSDFRSVLFFTGFAVLAAGLRLQPKQYLALGSLVVVTIALGVVWTAVKEDYRRYVSGGEVGQVVTVPYGERVTKLVDLAIALNRDQIHEGSIDLMNRLSYVDFFAVILEIVPKQLPHEKGALWWDAATRPFMPRLFFPGKTAIDDSARTNQYTGLDVMGAEAGTSISIGYMAESYIDFGAFGMMIPLFAFGYLLGFFYRWTLNQDPYRLLGMSLATATIYSASLLDSSITKVIGGLVVTALVSVIILRFAPRYFPFVERLSGR